MRYRFAEFELDTDRELLIGPQGPATLRPQAFRLLRHLIERAPALVTREELMDALWGHHALSPNVVPQTVSELRAALGDDPQQPRFVETRHRRGYAFIAAVEPIGTASAGPRPASIELLPTTLHRPELPPAAPRWPIPALLLALVGLLLVLAWQRALPPPAPLPLAASRLVLDWQADDARLDAYLRALAQASDGWVAPILPARGAAWRLQVDAHGAWQVLGPDGIERSRGELPVADVHTRALALARALEAASGQALLAREPLGWPQGSAAREALADGVLALREVRIERAVERLRSAVAATGEPGWAHWLLAEALARAGDWRVAREQLEALAQSPDRPLALRAEALAASLDGRPDEALAALRARALLVPEDADGVLELVDAQLAQAQWPAAAETLAALRRRAGDAVPALAWRLAQAGASQDPQRGEALHAQALQLATAAGDGEAMRMARIRHAQWLARRGRLTDAWTAVVALESDPDPRVAQLLGQLARERGELDRARADLERAQAAFLARGERGEARRARFDLGLVDFRRGDATSASEIARELLAAAEHSGDRRVEGDAHELLGLTLGALGQVEPALEQLRLAVQLAQVRGGPRQLALAQLGLGNLLAQQRRNEEAEAAFRAAASGFAAQGDDGGEATAMANLAGLATRAGRHQQAREAYAVALARMRELGIPREVGRIAFNLGVAEREQGQLAAAATHFDEALRALQEAGAIDLSIQAGASLAELALMQGDPAAARRALAAVAAQREAAAPAPRAALLAAEGRVHALAGDLESAERSYREARALREQAGARAWVLALDLRLLRLRLHDPAAARAARVPIERIEAEFLRLGEAGDALAAGLALVEAQLAGGAIAAAREKLEALRESVQTRGNRSQQHQFDWLLALASEPPLRHERLAAVATDADADGFGLLARLARREGLAAAQRAQADRELADLGLAAAGGSPAMAH